jgi:lysophospholipase L1-like esterase
VRRKGLYLFLSAAVAFVLIEGGLRLVLGLGSPPLLRADSSVGYVFQANQDLVRFTNRVHINQHHHRSGPLLSRADSTFVRVLFVGDSVTWGGVLTDQSDTIPSEAERQLANWCNEPVEALNASAGSWGIGNARAYIERYGLFESDLVVLQIGTHDLTQPKSTSGVVGNHRSYPNENPTLAIEELVTRYLWPRLSSSLPRFGSSANAQQRSRSGPEPEDVFARNLVHLRRTVASIRAEQTPVAILHTPNRSETTKGPGTSSAASYRKQFLQVADSMNVPVLNLANGWPRSTSPMHLYRDHVHFNERGNAVIADTLSGFLRAKCPSLCANTQNQEGS